jgi:polyhydroxyalkanoate synthesis regulator phasin
MSNSEALDKKALNAVSDANLIQQNTLLNLIRDSDSLEVGAGYRHPFPEKVEQIAAAAEKLKTERNKSFNSMMSRIEALQRQINKYDQEIDKLDKAIARAQAALDYYDENGEFEQNEDGTLKNAKLERDLRKWEEKNGTVDRNDQTALFAAIASMRAGQQVRRAEFAEKREDLRQEHNASVNDYNSQIGNRVGQLSIIKTLSDENVDRNVERAPTTNYGQDQRTEAQGRIDNQQNRFEASSSVRADEDIFDDFLGSDIFPAANAPNLNGNFTVAASGQIPTSEPSPETTLPTSSGPQGTSPVV